MKKKIFTGVLLLFIALFGIACSNGVSQEEYDEVWDEWMFTLDWVEELETELATIQKELVQSEGEVARLQAELAIVQSGGTRLQSELTAVRSQLANTQRQLAVFQAKYPPKKFPSGDVLQTWLNSDDISTRGRSSDAVAWLARALELQERAAKDGYIISVELTTEDEIYYSVLCTAVVGDGGFWWWDPETDDAYYWLDTRHF